MINIDINKGESTVPIASQTIFTHVPELNNSVELMDQFASIQDRVQLLHDLIDKLNASFRVPYGNDMFDAPPTCSTIEELRLYLDNVLGFLKDHDKLLCAQQREIWGVLLRYYERTWILSDIEDQIEKIGKYTPLETKVNLLQLILDRYNQEAVSRSTRHQRPPKLIIESIDNEEKLINSIENAIRVVTAHPFTPKRTNTTSNCPYLYTWNHFKKEMIETLRLLQEVLQPPSPHMSQRP